METRDDKSPHTLFWIAGIAVTVFSAVGIAAVMGWIPTSTSSSSEKIVAVEPGKPAQAPKRVRDPDRVVARQEARERARDEFRADARQDAKELAQAPCAECGVIESVREVETKGEGSGIGVVGGAVVGGVLGHQVGGGRGQDIATVAGAVGGAVAGNEIEKRVKSTKSYEITVRFENGLGRVIHEANTPSWRVGDRVKVVNGVIQSNA
jgi:outer membrane lipoprotein SlyB